MEAPTVHIHIPRDLHYPTALPVNDETIPRYEAESSVSFVPGGLNDIRTCLASLLEKHTAVCNQLFNVGGSRYRFYSVHLHGHFIRNREDVRFSMPSIYYYAYGNAGDRDADLRGRPKSLDTMVDEWMHHIHERQQYNSIPLVFDVRNHVRATVYITLLRKRRNIAASRTPPFIQYAQQVPIGEGILTRSRSRLPPERRYNLRSAGPIIVGALPKTFIRNPDVLDYFLTSQNTILFVPRTEEELCFPMGLARCQARIIRKNNTFETSKAQNFTKFMKNNAGMVYDDLDYPYVVQMFQSGWKPNCMYTRSKMVLFNPFVCTEDLEENDKKVAYIQQWKEMAWNLHQSVEEVVGEVDYRSLYDVGQVYADHFGIFIHIMHIKKGENFPYITFVPSRIDEYEVHIYMVMYEQDGLNHLYPVLNVRKFFCHQKSGNYINSLCDHCGDTRVRESPAWNTHLEDCRKMNRQCASKYYLEMSEKVAPSTKPHQSISVHYYCEECQHKRNYFNVKSCYESMHNVRRTFGVTCNICFASMTLEEQPKHLCYFNQPKDKEPIGENRLWVYDVESMQTKIERYTDRSVFEHTAILVCIQKMFDPNVRYSFNNYEDFANFIYTDEQFDDAVILAHNGGGYDNLFLLRHCDKNNWSYTTVPRPGSNHKLIQMQVTKENNTTMTFLDSIMFCATSLKNLALSFGLSVCKGDFPHHFSQEKHLHYVGRVPPVECEDDWYGLSTKKSEEDIEDLKEWYASQCLEYCTCGTIDQWVNHEIECTCGKKSWKFQEELAKYCWLDVQVLAEAMIKFRNHYLNLDGDEVYGWKAKSVDPFNFMTISQLCQYIHLHGFQTFPKIANIVFSNWPLFHPASIPWLCSVEQETGYEIIHRGNRLIEYFEPWKQCYVTGYQPATRTIYLYYHDGWSQDQRTEYEEYTRYWLDHRYQVQIQYHSEDRPLQKVIHFRGGFYGGRTEVFCARAVQKEPDPSSNYQGERLIYQDVCSLYPYVCANTEMPMDHPTIYIQNNVVNTIDLERLDPNHVDPYWGFIYATVTCPKTDLIGFLPSRDPITNRLVFDLKDKENIWHTSEIYLAMEHGYKVLDVAMVLHWGPDKRSVNFMKGYMAHFFGGKQEAEGWKKLGASSENPSEEEKDRLIEEAYINNGCLVRIKKERVFKNPVKRSLDKTCCNCLWGKLGQSQKCTCQFQITGINQYQMLMNDKRIDQTKVYLRSIGGDSFHVHYDMKAEDTFPMRSNNFCIAATVTAHARCILHREMYRVGPEKVIYCDTDSIIYFHPMNIQRTEIKGLGHFINEYPDHDIIRFLALGPKSYILEIRDKEMVIKSKGVQMTVDNVAKITYDKIEEMILKSVRREQIIPIQAHYMQIKPNSTIRDMDYALLLTCEGEKIIQPMYTKRNLMFDSDLDNLDTVNPVRLYPFGYENQNLPPINHTLDIDDDNEF